MRALIILLLIIAMWLVQIIIASPLQLPLTILALTTKSEFIRKWCLSIWIGQDQYINSVLFGNPDNTISSRVGMLSMMGNPVAKSLEKVIDGFFRITFKQQSHCRDSIENDEIVMWI